MKEYKEGSRFYDDLRRWHKKLEDQRDLRASLRRSSSLVDVYMSVGFRDLLKTVKYMDARNSESGVSVIGCDSGACFICKE